MFYRARDDDNASSKDEDNEDESKLLASFVKKPKIRPTKRREAVPVRAKRRSMTW